MELQDNKVIAEFMGLTIITDNISYFDTSYNPLKKYNKDWNELMEVVEKIENISTQKLSFNLKVEKDKVYLLYAHTSEPQKQIEMFFEWGQKTKIGNTYKIVVEFIKWYNLKLK